MTELTAGLPHSLQRMVDERLDTIDRMLLLSGVTRDERRATVAEVESQIHEMLSQRAPADPQRADVLAILSQLDPPEAYVPEEGQLERLREVPAPRTTAAASQSHSSLWLPGGSAAAAGMGGLALAGVIVGFLAESEEIGLLCGVIALFLGLVATIGGVASLFKLRGSQHPQLGLLLAVFSTLFLPLALVNLVQLFVALMFNELAIYPSLAGLILMTDGIVTYATWRMLSGRMRLAA